MGAQFGRLLTSKVNYYRCLNLFLWVKNFESKNIVSVKKITNIKYEESQQSPCSKTCSASVFAQVCCSILLPSAAKESYV